MKNRHRSRRRGLRARRGVTLIELIVASTILMTGLLSIVGVSAAVARSLGESRSDALAALAAQSRFETRAGSACTSFSLGTEVKTTTRGIAEAYTVTDAGNNTRLVVDVVSWKTRKFTRTATFQSLLPCRPGA
jgi:Tfp pilus assembly protein PilV